MPARKPSCAVAEAKGTRRRNRVPLTRVRSPHCGANKSVHGICENQGRQDHPSVLCKRQWRDVEETAANMSKVPGVERVSVPAYGRFIASFKDGVRIDLEAP